MRFPLEVVGAGKQKITCRIHIKYAYNMDFKMKLMIWMERARKVMRFKKNNTENRLRM
jgi:hypothetical protein